jgi:DNA-binding beta-propeller fold protein YncE
MIRIRKGLSHVDYHQRRNWQIPMILAIASILTITMAVGVATASDHESNVAEWEVWALDQGTGINRIHVYQPQNGEFAEVETIAFADLDAPHNEVQTPHMIAFDDSNRYAAIASTASGTVSVIRTIDYEVIETIETGGTAHMALFASAPDNSIWVANIGAQTFTQISSDLENEQFEIEREITLTSDLQEGNWPGWNDTYGDDLTNWPGPVCHEFTPDGEYAYVTMGPMAGGLVVVELSSGEIVQAFDPAEVRANCGLAFSHNLDQMYANWSGHLADLDDPHDAEPGEWYVFDIHNHELVGTHTAASSGTAGIDPHGTRVKPDGTEMWQVNRVSNDGTVVDTETQEVIDTFALSDTPDIIGFSPDGEWLFVTLRGPNPASMPHVAVGNTPGVEVIDTETRESVAILQSFGEDEAEASDFHGINVRGPIVIDTEAPEITGTADEDDYDAADLVPATGRDIPGDPMVVSFLIALLALGIAGVGMFLRPRVTRT